MAVSPSPVKRPARLSDDPRLETLGRSSRWPNPHLRTGSDSRLARRASKGDRRAIGAIFERYQQELYGFCLGLLGEPQDAQDALQNTMVKVLRALPGEEREIALRPWLYRIARNEAVELRRTRHPTQALDGYLVDAHSSVTERAEQREQLEWLLKDLGDLPERQRTVIVMRELSGLDFAEIGAALDTSGAVVRQSLYEARRNLEQMEHGRNLVCEAVTRVLSDADGRTMRRRDIRAHLRDCQDCRRFQDAIGRREGVLATIPPVSLPAGAAAGVAQSVFGGSGGGGTVAALTGGAAKSAGTYAALKAAATVAAVAVVGTAAMRSEVKSSAPPASDHPAFVQQRDSSRSSSSARWPSAVRSPHALGFSSRFAAAERASPAVPVSIRVADRIGRSSPESGHGSGLGATASLSSLPASAAPAIHPPAAGLEPEPVSGGSSDGASKPDKNPEKQQKGQAVEPEKEAGKPEHPTHPAHPTKAEATSGTVSPPSAESEQEAKKTPPGQAKKQVKAEEQAAAPGSPAPEDPLPAAEAEAEAEAETEATQPAPGSESPGKAKGHDK